MKRINIPGYNTDSLDSGLYNTNTMDGTPFPPPGSGLRITDDFAFRITDDGNFRITD